MGDDVGQVDARHDRAYVLRRQAGWVGRAEPILRRVAPGLGVGIRLISLFTMIKAYNRLKAGDETLWDANGGFVVRHEPLRAGRLVVVVLVVLAWAGLVVLGSQP